MQANTPNIVPIPLIVIFGYIRLSITQQTPITWIPHDLYKINTYMSINCIFTILFYSLQFNFLFFYSRLFLSIRLFLNLFLLYYIPFFTINLTYPFFFYMHIGS